MGIKILECLLRASDLKGPDYVNVYQSDSDGNIITGMSDERIYYMLMDLGGRKCDLSLVKPTWH